MVKRDILLTTGQWIILIAAIRTVSFLFCEAPTAIDSAAPEPLPRFSECVARSALRRLTLPSFLFLSSCQPQRVVLAPARV